MRFLIAILFPTLCFGQTIDTLSHAKAYRVNYLPVETYGLTSSGHKYAIGFNATTGQPLQAVRIDLTSKTVTYKTLTGTLSDPSALWQNCFDSLGNLYFGFNYGARKLFKFNLKDSIYFKNLGNGFGDGQALAYSMSLGLDKHVYFGASSGGTYWAEYDPYADTLYTHPEVHSTQQYVLSIQGDTNWVYTQLGQSGKIEYWAVRKSDNYKKNLWNIYASSRFNIRTGQGFCYVWPAVDTLNQTFRLKDTTATPIATYNAVTPNAYEEVNKRGVVTTFTYFDDAKSKLFYTINSGATTDSVDINAPADVADNIKIIFARDSGNTYFIGNLYGSWYKYNQSQDSLYKLGKTEYNIYSVLQWDDTTFYLGGYPNGALLKYITTQPFTAQTVNGVSLRATSRTTNPQLVTTFRTSTPANFHHLYHMIRMDSLIICAGNVIRTSNTCSIAVYNVNKDSSYGYDCNKINSLSCSQFCGVAQWNGMVYVSTNDGYGGSPKIYVYNPRTNVMQDSISVGLTDYGKMFIVGRILYGISELKLYKIDLEKKQLIYQQSIGGAYNSIVLPDARVYTYSTQASLPTDWWPITKMTYNVAYPSNNNLMFANGANLYKIRNVYTKSFDLAKPRDRVLYIKNKLGL